MQYGALQGEKLSAVDCTDSNWGNTSTVWVGRLSSVGIATRYGLDGPGIESRLIGDFPHLSRPASGPTQPPIQWVPVFPGSKERPGRDADPSPPSSAVVKKE